MNIKILLAITIFIVAQSTIQAKLSDYDTKQILSGWEDPQLKEILKELKRVDVSMQFFEAMRILDELRVEFDSQEQQFKKQLDDVQTKCQQQKNEIIAQIKKLNQQKGVKENYSSQNKQVQIFMQQSQQQYYEMLKMNQDILSSIEQDKQNLLITLSSQLEKNAKISANLEKIMKILVMIKNSPFQSVQYKQQISEYVLLLQRISKEDPLRILMESFKKVFTSNEVSPINEVLEVLINLVKNNQAETEYIQQSKETFMKNFKGQKEIVQNSIDELEQQIKNVDVILTNFADLFEQGDTFEDIMKKPKESSSVQALENKKSANEKACNKEFNKHLTQYESNKNKRQFVQILKQYIKLDSESVQQKLMILK